MAKRRSDEQIHRLLKEADRDLAKGLTVGDFCRKAGITEASCFDPAVADDSRRLRQLQTEVERLKQLVAELMLDNRMLQDVAQKKW
jgi:putative transposase